MAVRQEFRQYKLNRDFIMKRCAELNTTISEESRKLGYASGYIGQCIGRGCNKMQLITICNILGCSEEDVLVKEIVEEPQVIEEEPKTDNSDILSELQKMNKTLDDIANCFAVMVKLYERAWIDKE